MNAPPALHVECSGSGPPLVLLHGWAMNLRVFDGLAAQLRQRFTVHAVDLPGHGRSPIGAGAGSEDLLTAVRAVVPPRAVLLGWSLGGQLALRLAAEAALEVRALVLLHTTARFVADAPGDGGLPPQTVQGFAARLDRDVQRTVFDFLELQVRGSACAADTLERLRRALQEQGMAQPVALHLGLQWLCGTDLRSLLPQIAQPALVVGGEYDRVTPPKAQQLLAQQLPAAQLLELAPAGHASFLSHSAELLPRLTVFLAPWSAAA